MKQVSDVLQLLFDYRGRLLQLLVHPVLKTFHRPDEEIAHML